MKPKERNERARKSAAADPVAFLDYAAGNGWLALSRALDAWEWERFISIDGATPSGLEPAAKKTKTPEWRALDILDLVTMHREGRSITRNRLRATALIAHLTALPIAPDSKTGLTLLTKVVDAWQRQPVTPDRARVRVVENATRQPYAASEASRRAWIPAADVTAINVDGKPLAARIQDARPKDALDWLYVDAPEIVPDPGGNQMLPDPSFGVYPQNARDMPLTMVALRMLGDLDGRSALRGDVRTVLTVAYATTRAVAWADEEGARLLARTRTGGFRSPKSGDVQRWRDAVELADSMRLYYRDKYGRDYIRVLVADPYGYGRREIAPPAWFRERAGDPDASPGAGMGWTLTGAAHPARQRGTTASGTAYAHTIASMEYWLARSYDGEPGTAPLLRPVRLGGPGPWVRMRWYEVLERLALDRFARTDAKARDAALRRYWRLVEALRRAEYMIHGDAGSGDVVECEVSPRMGSKSGRAVPWLQFRATTRFCEAARLATTGKWQTTGLLEWFGLCE